MFCYGTDTTGRILGTGAVVPAPATATETPRLQSASRLREKGLRGWQFTWTFPFPTEKEDGASPSGPRDVQPGDGHSEGHRAAETPSSPHPPREVLVRFEQMGAGEPNRKDVCGKIRPLLGWRGC